jgi:hypothetical protein
VSDFWYFGWVISLWGTWDGDLDEANDAYWHAKICANKELSHGLRETCEKQDIRNAVALLTHYVKAHADILNGRNGSGKLVPSDLFGDGESAEVKKQNDDMTATHQKHKDNRCSAKLVHVQ